MLLTWTKIPGKPDFEASDYVAVYKRTIKGHPCFWVFPKTETKRTETRALSVGGLPASTEQMRAP